mmetsp:Transcript_32108/g.75381  ORF Transcript_32108/g.75381 Transcript_32108/m.75381 type:complete len:119 (-) Transcript_32108:45-401(-)
MKLHALAGLYIVCATSVFLTADALKHQIQQERTAVPSAPKPTFIESLAANARLVLPFDSLRTVHHVKERGEVAEAISHPQEVVTPGSGILWPMLSMAFGFISLAIVWSCNSQALKSAS